MATRGIQSHYQNDEHLSKVSTRGVTVIWGITLHNRVFVKVIVAQISKRQNWVIIRIVDNNVCN